MLVGRGRRLADDPGSDAAAPLRVGNADDGGFRDGGMRFQHHLDLARIDVEAAADDDVVAAIDERQVPASVEAPEVAGVQPAVDQRRRGRGRVAPILPHQLRPVDGDRPDLARREWHTVGTEHLDLVQRGREPTRPAPARLVMVLLPEGRDRKRALAETVDLQEHRSEHGERPDDHVIRHRGRAVHDRTQARQLAGLRPLDQGRDHGRHEERRRDAFAPDQIAKGGGLELATKDAARPAPEGGLEQRFARVRQRCHVRERVARAELVQLGE